MSDHPNFLSIHHQCKLIYIFMYEEICCMLISLLCFVMVCLSHQQIVIFSMPLLRFSSFLSCCTDFQLSVAKRHVRNNMSLVPVYDLKEISKSYTHINNLTAIVENFFFFQKEHQHQKYRISLEDCCTFHSEIKSSRQYAVKTML